MPQFDSNVVPDVTGRLIGLPDQRYDANIRNMNISGAVTGAFEGLAVNRLAHVVIPFSANPVFDILEGSGFAITLSNNVVSSTLLNIAAGTLIAFVIRQDPTGGRTFVWPPNVSGGADIGTGPNERTVQLFYSDGLAAYAVTPGVIQ